MTAAADATTPDPSNESEGPDWFQPKEMLVAFKRPQNNREVNLHLHPELGWPAAAPPLRDALCLYAEFCALEGLPVPVITELGRDRHIQRNLYRLPKETLILKAIASGRRDDPQAQELLAQYRRTYANLKGMVPAVRLEAETVEVLAKRLAWEEFTWHFTQRHTEEEPWQSWAGDVRTVVNVGTTTRPVYTDAQARAGIAYVDKRMPAAGFELHSIEGNAPHLHVQVRDPRGRGRLVLEQAIQACY